MKLPSPEPNAVRLPLLALIAAGAVAFLLAGGYRFLSFNNLVAHKDAVIDWADARPLLAPGVWVAAYLVVVLFGLPGSTVLNLSAGLLFDFWEGLLLVVAGSTLASGLAFLSFRYLLGDFVEERMRRRFPRLLEGLEREGVYFVLTLRLVPVIPFSATNLILAMSPVRFAPFLVWSKASCARRSTGPNSPLGQEHRAYQVPRRGPQVKEALRREGAQEKTFLAPRASRRQQNRRREGVTLVSMRHSAPQFPLPPYMPSCRSKKKPRGSGAF